MFVINKQTNEIVLPRGDTLAFKINLRGTNFPEDTVALFGVCGADRRGNPTTTIFSKAFRVYKNCVYIFLSNQDTRNLRAGGYVWDLRIVTDPEYDEDGNVRCEDISDNVISIFSGSVDLPSFVVKGVAVNV